MLMKIERINDNQIRCTLTSEDLSGRQIRLSELAYGSDKARQLFHDMMQEARQTVGFAPGSSPLMIEAIPVSGDSLVLIITRVDDPEELDTRFSRFTRSEDMPVQDRPQAFPGADEVLELFNRIFDRQGTSAGDDASSPSQENSGAPASAGQSRRISDTDGLVQAFRFRSLDDVIEAAHCTVPYFDGESSLYRMPEDGSCRLVVHQSSIPPEEFNRICNTFSEYGAAEILSPARAAWLSEHGHLLIRGCALQKLREL